MDLRLRDYALVHLKCEDIMLAPYAIFPAGYRVTAERQVITLSPGFIGILPNTFTIHNDRNSNPQIVSLKVIPSDPAPFQTYAVSVGYIGANDNSVVTVTVRGTDSFSDVEHCSGDHDACVLLVPGAQEQVEDNVEVAISNTDTGYTAEYSVTVRF